MAEIHVRGADGRYLTGVDGLVAIWRTLPNPSVLRLLAAIISLPIIHSLAKGVYFVFAKNRHRLSRRIPR
jgi:predicted DCC family thiol-disulfide oxidoreductase YuxK